MPSGVFRPYAGVATAILIFTKGGETNEVWFYEMQSDGYSLDDKRTPLIQTDGSRNYGDLHFIIDVYKKRDPRKESDRTQKHFFVPKTEIISKDYDLSLNKYKQEVYNEVVYEKPEIILEKLSSLETTIVNGINELKEIIG